MKFIYFVLSYEFQYCGVMQGQLKGDIFQFI